MRNSAVSNITHEANDYVQTHHFILAASVQFGCVQYYIRSKRLCTVTPFYIGRKCAIRLCPILHTKQTIMYGHTILYWPQVRNSAVYNITYEANDYVQTHHFILAASAQFGCVQYYIRSKRICTVTPFYIGRKCVIRLCPILHTKQTTMYSHIILYWPQVRNSAVSNITYEVNVSVADLLSFAQNLIEYLFRYFSESQT